MYSIDKSRYYLKIPETVIKDNSLNPMAKLLYARIYSFNSICYATNSYFAKYFDVTIRTIQLNISQLSKKEYIFLKYNNNKRIIFINRDKL